MRQYRFMTGAHTYRVQAASREEALQIAVDSLNPNADALKVIETTLYEEGAEKTFSRARPAQPTLAWSREENTIGG